MPSSRSWNTARRWAAARWIFAWMMGSTARSGWTDMANLSGWGPSAQYSDSLPAEVRHGQDEREGLQRGAEEKRRADAPIPLGQGRNRRQQGRAQRGSDHRHQAVQTPHRAQRLALAARVGGAGDDALHRGGDGGAQQIDENDREHH